MFKVGFSRPKKQTIFSKLIQLIQGTEYSHTFITFDVRSTGQKIIYHATHKGVNCLEYKTFQEDNIILDEIEIESEESRTEALSFCISQLGKPYSLAAIFAILLNIKFGDNTKSFICSELVARALKLDLNKLDLVTPRDIREYFENESKT